MLKNMDDSNRHKTNKVKMRFYQTHMFSYFIIFILFFGYSLSISSSVAPVYIFDKPNLSMYAYGDLLLTILGNVSIFALLVVLFFLGYRVINDQLTLKKVLTYRMANIFIYILIIYVSIFFAYVFTLGKNSFNFGFSDRSSLQYIIPAPGAILLSFLYFCFYLTVFLIIALIIENSTKKSWVAVTLSIFISFIDVQFRTIFQFRSLIGILPSDNAAVFYLNNLFFDFKRPSYLFSFIYWIVFISILCIVLFLVNKKNQPVGDRK